MRCTVVIVYEISNNPYYQDFNVNPESPITELARPEEIDCLTRALKILGYKVEIVDGPKQLAILASTFSRDKNIIIFHKSRGVSGLERKSYVPAICDLYELPYVGSSGYPSTLARHKYHTNRILQGLGFNVPEALICYPGQLITIPELMFPVILKPNHESGSLGISEASIHSTPARIETAIQDLHQKFKQPVVIEQFVDGEEWKVAVVGNRSNAQALGCVGVMHKGVLITGSLQSREDVIQGQLSYYRPSDSPLLSQALSKAIEIHNALGFNDYSRCDFRIARDNTLVCMEVSTHPEICESSSFVVAAMHSVPNYETLIELILSVSISRYEKAFTRIDKEPKDVYPQNL